MGCCYWEVETGAAGLSLKAHVFSLTSGDVQKNLHAQCSVLFRSSKQAQTDEAPFHLDLDYGLHQGASS